MRSQGIWRGSPTRERQPRAPRQPTRWVRVSVGIADHPDLTGLPSYAARWAFIVLLTKAKVQPEPGTFRSEEHLGHILGRGLRQCLPSLIAAGLITPAEGGGYVVHNWQRWQSPERVDTTHADRQRRYRERRKAQSDGVTRSVTPEAMVTSRDGGPPLTGVRAPTVTRPAVESGDVTVWDQADSVTCHDYSRHQSHHHLSSEGWTCDLCRRRDLARIVREAPSEAMRHRYRKIFDRTYGGLYSKQAPA